MKKYAIVTGAYGAIGKAISSGIAEQNYALLIVGKDEEKLLSNREDIIKKTGNTDIQAVKIDLSSRAKIESFADKLKISPSVLINNAATTPGNRLVNSEGIEMQFAVNVLGYFYMMKFIAPKMQRGSRIVNVASYWAGDLDMNDLEFKKRTYDNDMAYRQSKQANRMLSVAFAEKLKLSGIMVNSCHPGDVNSKLSNNLGYGGHETPEQGADTPVWLAISQELNQVTGKYFEHRREIRCHFSENINEVMRLFDLCLAYR